MKNYFNCIYMYKNKINGKCYIGQAKDFNKRHKSHLCSSKNSKLRDYNYPIHKAIRKYGIENFNIKILAENIPTQEKLNEYEIFFIKRHKSLKTQNGYNIANGGEGGSNNFAGKTSKEMDDIKKRNSESQKRVWENKTQKEINDFKIKRSSNWTINNPMKDKEISKKITGKNNSRAIKINQYSKDRTLIKTWDCIRDIQRELGYSSSHICNCCKYYLLGEKEYKKQYKSYPVKTYKNYIWKYAEEVE